MTLATCSCWKGGLGALSLLTAPLRSSGLSTRRSQPAAEGNPRFGSAGNANTDGCCCQSYSEEERLRSLIERARAAVWPGSCLQNQWDLKVPASAARGSENKLGVELHQGCSAEQHQIQNCRDALPGLSAVPWEVEPVTNCM